VLWLLSQAVTEPVERVEAFMLWSTCWHVKKYPEKKTLIYRERDEASRIKFVRRIKRISPKNLVYVDASALRQSSVTTWLSNRESGVNKYLYREYARAPRGQKITGEISGKKYKRTNIVSGYCCGKWVAPLQWFDKWSLSLSKCSPTI
jgi:hypothetical protein